jgi:hypothetical protein
MSKRVLCAAALLALGLVIVLPVRSALADLKGRQRVVLMDGKFIDGEVISETRDAYVIQSKPGITSTVRKNQVARIVPITETGAMTNDIHAPGTPQKADAAALISDSEISNIIGDVSVDEGDIEGDTASMDEMGEALEVDESAVNEMKKIAGAKAKVLRKPHFVLVYTSEDELARKLASLLESVYRWNVKMANMLGVPTVKPAHALEVYFFGTHQEYEAYGNTRGGIPPGAIGFYMRTNNRSAFFDLNDEPGLAELGKRLKEKDIHWRIRQYVSNRIKKRQDFLNQTVVQHEAAHHIHFNIGIFPREGDLPRWMTEGLAQMFEAPPTKLGTGLGAVNNYGLHEFKDQFYPRVEALGDFRRFIVDQSAFTLSRHSYCKAWALCHYLWKTKRDKFALWMQLMSKRESNKDVTPTQVQKEFEDLFGTVDEKWVADFHKYITSLQVAHSVLPDE